MTKTLTKTETVEGKITCQSLVLVSDLKFNCDPMSCWSDDDHSYVTTEKTAQLHVSPPDCTRSVFKSNLESNYMIFLERHIFS